MTISDWLQHKHAAHDCLSLGKRFHSHTLIDQNRASECQQRVVDFLRCRLYTPAKPYCYKSRSSVENYRCDGWMGRRQILIRPSINQQLKRRKRKTVTTHNCHESNHKAVVNVRDACFHEFRGSLVVDLKQHSPTISDQRKIRYKVNASYETGIPYFAQSHQIATDPYFIRDDAFIQFVESRDLSIFAHLSSYS